MSALSQKRSFDGLVCQRCMDHLPHVIQGSLSAYQSDILREIIEYEDDMRAGNFEATASYGRLYLDELNGLFAIGEKAGLKGVKQDGLDIFDCSMLENIGLYPVEARQSKKDVVCDVEFSCIFRYPQMRFKLKIRNGVKCDYKQISKTQATWSEPGELSMFRNMLNQTIKTSVNKAMEKRERILSPYDIDLMKARACLHVYEGCTNEVIEKQYNLMRKMYEQSSYSKEEIDGYLKSLGYYRKLLVHGGNQS